MRALVPKTQKQSAPHPLMQSGIAALLLSAALCLGACAAPAASSAYDLPGLLEANPQDIPPTLEHLGFTYVQGAPVGWWDNPDTLDGAPEGSTARIGFYTPIDQPNYLAEVSPDLLKEGQRPESVSLFFDCDFALEEGEADAAMDAILERAGFADEAYRNRTEDAQWNRVTLERAGTITPAETSEGENNAAYWGLWAIIEQEYGSTTFCLSVYTQKGAETDGSPGLKAAMSE